MKATIAVAATALLLALPATAAAPRDPRVPALQRQVTALQGQVAALSAQVSALRTQMTQNNQRQQDLTVCFEATDRDSLNGQWHIIALIVQVLTGAPPGPDLPRFDDRGACANVGITRVG